MHGTIFSRQVIGWALGIGLIVGCAAATPSTAPASPTATANTVVPASSAPASSATAVSTPSPAATPVGFVLPQGCSYVGSPTTTSGQTEWRFDCGTTANHDARGALGPALTQQGWTQCGSVTATATWAKATTELVVSESSGAAGDYPKLAQHARTIACP